jgi:hypothetical protein
VCSQFRSRWDTDCARLFTCDIHPAPNLIPLYLYLSLSLFLPSSERVRSALRTASCRTPLTWPCSLVERYVCVRQHTAHCSEFFLHDTLSRTLHPITIALKILSSVFCCFPLLSLPSIPSPSLSPLISSLISIVQARAIIKAEPPFAIMHINEPWTALSGLSQAEAEGRPLSDSLRLHSSQVGLNTKALP